MIGEILDKVLVKTGLEYKITDRDVIVKQKGSADPVTLVQQQRSVSGKVTDERGGSLPGVSVVVKGTVTGVITDNDGNYTLGNIPENATLVFSFVGMKTQEVSVGARNTINIVMIEETIGVDEVIITGVASGTPKRKLGFAIDKISAKSLQLVPAVDASTALQGKVAGIKITKTSGAPGASSDIQLRGVKTIFGSSNPLIIVDGVQTELGLSDVNAQDIESIEVLKGAAASSLYGSRAANGVVSIFTKRGSSMAAGKVQVDYRIETGKSYIGYVPPKSIATNKIVANGVVTTNDDPDQVMDNPYPKTYDHVSQFFNPGGYTTNFLSLKGNSSDSRLSVYSSFQSTKEQGIVSMVDGNSRDNFKISPINGTSQHQPCFPSLNRITEPRGHSLFYWIVTPMQT